MRNINFEKVIAFNVRDAIIYIEYDFLKKRLSDEWKGCKKQIKGRERIHEIDPDLDKIVKYQLSGYKKQFVVLDSIKRCLKSVDPGKDTLFISYDIFYKSGSLFGDFIPNLIESGQCIIMNKDNNRQLYIIRQTGTKKTGQMTGVGSSLYFLAGSENYFWGKMNWVS